MAGKRTPEGEEAERLCKQFPDAPTQQLARRLAKSHKCSLDVARYKIRYYRGAAGKKWRHCATVPRERKQPGEIIHQIPPSLAEPWTPFDLGNNIRVAVLSDVHIPYHSTVALEAAVKHCKKMKPNVLLLNGDFADFYSISRHQKDPSKRDFKQEMQLCQQALRWLRQEFGKKCRFVLKAGNHEERLKHFLWNQAPEICDSPRMTLKEWLTTDEKTHEPVAGEIEVVENQRPIMVGRLPVLHGHELGKSGLAPINPARGAFLRTISTVLIGHCHRTSHHVEPDIWHKQTSCFSTGCLCELNPQYAIVNRWNHGAAFITVDNSAEFQVQNFRIGPSGDIWL